MKFTELRKNTIIISVIVSLLLILLGHNFILQRELNSPSKYLTISDDALEYKSMIEGDFDSIHSPLKYRILVPFLASLLPFTPLESLRIISYVSLFVFYIMNILICIKLGMNKGSTLLALVCTFATLSHLYNYHNPFLTDAFGLLVISFLIYAYIIESFPTFIIVCIVGLFARETTIFLATIWLTKDFKKGMILIVICLLLIIIPRISLITGSGDVSMTSLFVSIGIAKLKSFLSTLINIFDTFGFLWLILFIGLGLIGMKKNKDIIVISIALFVGAIITSSIATDTVRMFSILFPVVCVATAKFISVLFQKKDWLGITLLLFLTIIQLLTAIPNIIFDQNSFVFPYSRLHNILSMIGIIYGLVYAYLLREDLASSYSIGKN